MPEVGDTGRGVDTGEISEDQGEGTGKGSVEMLLEPGGSSVVVAILSSGPPTHIIDLIPLLEPSSLPLPHCHLASTVFQAELGTCVPSNVSSAPRITQP